MCAAEFVCALDVFARHTSSGITFLALTIVGRSWGDVSSHQDISQTFGFPESQDGWFFEDFGMVVQCLRTMLDKLLSTGWYVMTNGTLLFVFFSLYWMRSFLSISTALSKQWLMLALFNPSFPDDISVPQAVFL